MILDFLKDKPNFKLISMYEDTNKTGTNFNRSDFEKLLNDTKKGILRVQKNKGLIWKEDTIKSILKNEFYIGNMVQGKSKKDLSKNQKRETVDNKDWIKVENTHTPIISKEVFYQVQEINNNNREKYYLRHKKKSFKKNYDNIFKNFIVCGECGSKLYRINKKEKIEIKPIIIFYVNYITIKNVNLYL